MIIAIAVVFGISGYRQGFVVGLLSFVGFLGGAVVGAKLAAPFARVFTADTRTQAVVGLVLVFALACVGQLVATVAGAGVRRRITWQPVRFLDSAAGALFSIVPVLLVAWLLGRAVVVSPFRALAAQAQRSTILAAVDSAMPGEAQTWFASLVRLLDQQGFPQVFGALGPPSIVGVAPPDPAVLGGPGLRAAEGSVVKIKGVAPSCDRSLEGSGFVFAPNRVMTNAHVVAGVDNPVVIVPGRGSVPASVVVYDPERDVAVLDVPGLGAPALRFGGVAPDGQSAVVVGYPGDGPLQVRPARIRNREEATGTDIYQANRVTREIYALRGVVQPGNSGGPLLSASGAVYGVVFAASVDDPETGYALTAGEVTSDAAVGARASAAVGTGSCD